ncbi:MAG: tetratricopeptide repeat protein [Fimbriiglobus sp.]
MPDPAKLFADAVAAHRANDLPAAEKLYRETVAADPGHASAWCNLGVLAVRCGQLDAAADCYRRALAVSPGLADAHFNLGNLYRRVGRHPEAGREYELCLKSNPGHLGATFNLGIVHATLGNLDHAAECFRASLSANPADLDARLRLGDALMRAGKLDAAVAEFRTATEQAPVEPRAWYNLGLALHSAGRPADAEHALTTALERRPEYPDAHNALGLVWEQAGRKDDAAERYRAAVGIHPDFADGWSNLGVNLCEQGRADDAIECLRRSLAVRPTAAMIHGNLLLFLNYSSRVTPEQIVAEHRIFAERFAAPVPPRPPVPLPHDPARKLRVGYLSADFRGHTVSGFIELLLKNHDPDRVVVFAYPSVFRPDATTERLRGLCDKWRPIAGLSDDRAADLIRSDGVDVLVDLGGHTASNRLLVLARRPAPVQATVFGYPATTGLPAVDLRITDPVSDPPGMTESLNIEALLRLPDVAWVYRPPADAPPVGPLPTATNRAFTFGSFNNAAKFSDACLEAWAGILTAVPDSRLVLLAGQSKAGARRLADIFAAAGIAADRVTLLPRMSVADYFAAHGQLDVALDPFPYNGGVTSADALWMGVPVLGIAGRTYVSRQGAMLMGRVGHPGFTADSPAGLIELAKAWSEKRSELAVIRAGLRERMIASPICDAKRYVRNLEAALRTVWRAVLA